MKSVKPGRAPSMMGGVVGIVMICFGILWTVLTAQAFGPFAIFGVLWTCLAIAITVYNFKNATNKNRYSSFDIVDDNEEPDPLNQRFGNNHPDDPIKSEPENKFCPYCGTPVGGDFEFCNNCGKRLP